MPVEYLPLRISGDYWREVHPHFGDGGGSTINADPGHVKREVSDGIWIDEEIRKMFTVF